MGVQPQLQSVLGLSLRWVGASWWTQTPLTLGVKVRAEIPQLMQVSSPKVRQDWDNGAVSPTTPGFPCTRGAPDHTRDTTSPKHDT